MGEIAFTRAMDRREVAFTFWIVLIVLGLILGVMGVIFAFL